MVFYLLIKVITERKIAEEIEFVVIFAMAMFYFSIMVGVTLQISSLGCSHKGIL